MMALWLVVLGCVGDDPRFGSEVRRGGLAVRLVIADSSRDPGDLPCPGDEGDNDEEGDEDEGEEDVASLGFDSVRMVLDELRLTVSRLDAEPQTFSVPLDRRIDLVGPASSDDEIVLDLQLADYETSTVSLVARPGDGTPAVAADAVACVADDEDHRAHVVGIAVAEPIEIASSPVRLVIGDGPDPRVRIGLQVDRWLDGMEPPDNAETDWVIDATSADYPRLIENITTALETTVD